MVQKNHLGSIVIDNYIRKVALSKAQREKYYEWDGTTIKSGSKKLLKKYINPIHKDDIILNNGNVLPIHLLYGYCIVGYKGNYIYSRIDPVTTIVDVINTLTPSQLLKETKYILCKEVEDGLKTYSMVYEKVIANETQAGKPKEHIINGQAFYNQTLNPFARVKVMEAIKLMYFNKFTSIPKAKFKAFKRVLNASYPLYIELEIRDTVKSSYDNTKNDIGRQWDVGNRAEPYMKGFLDFLVKGHIKTDKKTKIESVLMNPIIENDDRLHITSGNNSYFTPIEPFETRQLVFHFHADTREIWKSFNI